jgi:hypothetical protein
MVTRISGENSTTNRHVTPSRAANDDDDDDKASLFHSTAVQERTRPEAAGFWDVMAV